MVSDFSVCYIAKNEEKNISESIGKLVELLGRPDNVGYEILVLDTGSTDKTVNVAETLGARVERFEWINDFSAARNAAMRYAKYDRILFIDADEMPEKIDFDELISLWREYPDAIGRIERRNLCNNSEGGTCIATDRVERFFDRRLYHYEGVIHEQVVRNDKGRLFGYPLPFTVYHEGYYGSEQQLKEKAARNNELLFSELKKNLNDPYIYYQLGQSYDLMGDSEAAVKYYEKGYGLNPDRKAEYSGVMICNLGKALAEQGRYDEAEKLIDSELHNYNNLADFLCFAAYTYMRKGNLENAINFYNKAFDSTDRYIEGSVDFIPAYNLGCIYEALGDELKSKEYFEKSSSLGYEKATKRLNELLTDDFDYVSKKKYISIIVPINKENEDVYKIGQLCECILGQSVGIGHIEVIFVIMTDSKDVISELAGIERTHENSICLFYPDAGISIEEGIAEAFGYTTADSVMLLKVGCLLKWDAIRMMNAAINSGDIDMVIHGVNYSDSDFILTIENEQMRDEVKNAGIIGQASSGVLYRMSFLIEKNVTPYNLLNGDAGILFAEKIYCIKENLELLTKNGKSNVDSTENALSNNDGAGSGANIMVSVIIPCYNSGEYIDVCMGSLIAQTIGWKHLQVILVDDASDDGDTLEKLKNYEMKYPENVVLILNDKNIGPGGCRNIGLKYSLGEYTTYVDSDDWLGKNALKTLYDYAIEYDADVVDHGHIMVYDHDGKEIAENKAEGEKQLFVIDSIEKRKEFILPSDSSVACTDKLFSTKLLKYNNILFAEHISCEEIPFIYTVRFYSNRYLVITERFYYYYKRLNSLSDVDNYKKNRFDIVEGYLLLFEEIKKRGFQELYLEEIDFLFWCGAFYLPLFNIAATGGEYTKDEYECIRQAVSSRVNDICSNYYFKSAFSNMEIIGKITYLPADDSIFEDIKQLFRGLTTESA